MQRRRGETCGKKADAIKYSRHFAHIRVAAQPFYFIDTIENYIL